MRLSALVLLAILTSFTALYTEANKRYPLSRALKRDRAALLAFKRATIRYGKSKMSAWSKSGHPCKPATWPHVECRLVWPRSGPPNHRVHSLNVANCSVVARLPVRLGKLMMAEEVNLEGNRIVGKIPRKWGKRLYFRRLKRLVLRNNRLSGTLPNNWNTRSGWSRLQTLDLSGNKLKGGLPSTWLGGRKPFRRLNYLDLSENQLGLQADGIPYPSSEAPDGWCTGGRNDFDSWCPTASNFQPRKSKMPNLVSLDISNNMLQGVLPSKWGYMFPSLQFLLIHTNKLYSSSKGVAEALPASWTRQIVPTAFRSLTVLMLHPGNGFICALPAPVEQGIMFEQTQRDAEFAIVDKHYEQYDSSGPWLCPGPAAPLPATDPGVNMVNFGLTNNNIILKWQAPLPNPQDSIYGYKVYLWLSDPDQGIIPGWLGKFFRTYDASLPSEMTVMGGLCILSTGILADGFDHSQGEYTMAVEVVYIDGQVSDALIATGSAT